MRITKVTLKIRPEMAGIYEETFLRLRQLVLDHEPACTLFELCRDPVEAGTYHAIEAYADDAAVLNHITTPYYNETARIFVECLVGDHMSVIEERGLEGVEMYRAVEGMRFERLETLS